MKRAQVEELLREAGRLSASAEFVVIGSQAVHAVTDAAPAEVLVSLECDVLFEVDEATAEVLRRELGPTSEYRVRHGFYLDAVPPGLPVLPSGWSERLVPLDAGGVVGRCLEAHDLAVAKLAAGRLKDYELVAALIDRTLIVPERVGERIALVEGERMRVVLLARLRIVMESLNRPRD
jgi:hypothetical protein